MQMFLWLVFYLSMVALGRVILHFIFKLFQRNPHVLIVFAMDLLMIQVSYFTHRYQYFVKIYLLLIEAKIQLFALTHFGIMF